MFAPDAWRPLGATGILVSPLGLGTVKFGRNTNVKYPSRFELPDDLALTNLLHIARDCGINLIDTAPAYGDSERRVGHLLRGQRHGWVITTKVGEQYHHQQSRWDFSPAATRQSIDESLSRLQTDYLDIVLVHSDGNDIAIINESGSIETLRELKTAGKIRAIGMSTKTVAGGLLALDRCDVEMVTYNEVEVSELPVLNAAAAQNKGVLVKKALASGHSDNPGEALRQVLAHAAVSSAIVGTISPAHLVANVEAVTTIPGFCAPTR